MTADSLKKRALKAAGECVENAQTADPDVAIKWADTAAILVRVASEADIIVRANT